MTEQSWKRGVVLRAIAKTMGLEAWMRGVIYVVVYYNRKPTPEQLGSGLHLEVLEQILLQNGLPVNPLLSYIDHEMWEEAEEEILKITDESIVEEELGEIFQKLHDRLKEAEGKHDDMRACIDISASNLRAMADAAAVLKKIQPLDV